MIGSNIQSYSHWPRFIWLAAILLIAPTGIAPAQDSKIDNNQEVNPHRVTGGIILVCDFTSNDGDIVRDRSGLKPTLDFKIKNQNALARAEHSVEFKSTSIIQTPGIGPRIAAAIIRSGELTLEAWIEPADLDQKGPARVFTYSRNSNDRNFTMGQEGDQFEFRVRSTKTSNNGTPALRSKPATVKTELTHVVYTRDRTGRTRIYLNGELNVEEHLAGDLTNWTADFPLAIGNEITNDRPWLGKLFLVAIYQRDLLPSEVRQNFAAGANAKTIIAGARNVSESTFVSKIAPIIANHCLECHDATSQEGGLNLSSRTAAMAGGDSGTTIIPGKPYDSSFWTQVVANQMPQERPPLSAKQKQILKVWIDGGANWVGGDLDPALFGEKKNEISGIWVRRLTVAEYIATVKAAVGVDITKEAREILPADLRADGFNNTAYNLNVDLKHVAAHAKLAELISHRANINALMNRFEIEKKWSDENARQLVLGMGKWLFRSPLEDHEFETYLRVVQTVQQTGGGFSEATEFVLEAMLQSPRFIYLIENQRGDGARWPVGDYELASRLSYILWGAPPDEQLIAAVDRGDFYDRDDQAGVKKQIERMLDDPRAIDRSVEFLNQWLDLDRLSHLKPNVKKFPNWNASLANDMRLETIEYFKEVTWVQKRPLIELLNTQLTFATPSLATHYGLPSNVSLDRNSKADELTRYELTDVAGRGGLLTHGSVLTMGGDEASMVTRGLFVLKDLLRGVVKDPPPCVDSTPVPTKAGLTQRKIAEARIANASCGGCHSKFEPLAFGLERFDGLGGYHETDEHGNKLRDDGQVLFPGKAKPKPYANSAELMELLVKSDRVKESLTWKLTQFAVGRPLGSADATIVKQIYQKAERNGGTYQSLITEILLSDLVQRTPTELPNQKPKK